MSDSLSKIKAATDLGRSVFEAFAERHEGAPSSLATRVEQRLVRSLAANRRENVSRESEKPTFVARRNSPETEKKFS
jgi:hypothetical protein